MSRILLAALIIARIAAAAPNRGATPEDYYALRQVTDVQMSPDGRQIAYVVTSVDKQANRRNNVIWMVPVSGGPSKQLTSAPSSRFPRWSPDSKTIAFVSTMPDAAGPANAQRPQVFTVSTDGGAPVRVTNLPGGVEALQWHPTGAKLVCISRTGPQRRRFADGGSDVRHYLSAAYKTNDGGFFDDRRTHLFVVDLKDKSATQLTDGNTRNDLDPQWSPDGTKILFLTDNTDRMVFENVRPAVVPAAGGSLIYLTEKEGLVQAPRWSPDGARVAWIGGAGVETPPKIWIAPAEGGKAELAARELSVVPAELDWPASGGPYFTAMDRGSFHLFRIDTAAHKAVPVLSGERGYHHPSFHIESGAMAYTANDFRHPDDLFVSRLDGKDEKQLTHLNQDQLAQLDLPDVERVPYKASDGTPVEGFFVKPHGWAADKKYPMILSIHGGPSNMYGVEWSHEFQTYAGRGWAVFFTNPRGSSGYGDAFQRGVNLEWGGKAYIDIMTGVDVILKKYPWVDAGRVGVSGGSYGGFMTNWIVSHTDRFKAAVSMRSIVNFISVEGTRDAAYSHRLDFGGDLFQNFQFYWDSSPLKYADRVHTPILIMTSDNDERVPREQSEQWFRALKHFGNVPTELVIFPRETHNLTRSGEPRHLVESLNWQHYWFRRFLENDSAAIRPTDL